MNPMILSAFLVASLASTATAIFSGGLAIGAAAGGLALTAGTGTVFLTSAGVAAAGLGLLGAAVVKGALIGGRGGGFGFDDRRHKRQAEESEESAAQLVALQLVDSYFMTILDVDVDDCGKKLVCEIQTVAAADRSSEEAMIATLFEGGSQVDPLSAKAEYDLAAFIGQNYEAAVCGRRYHRCQYDRKTILAALRKAEKQ